MSRKMKTRSVFSAKAHKMGLKANSRRKMGRKTKRATYTKTK